MGEVIPLRRRAGIPLHAPVSCFEDISIRMGRHAAFLRHRQRFAAEGLSGSRLDAHAFAAVAIERCLS